MDKLERLLNLTAALIDTVVDRYFPVLEGLEEELEAVERHIFNGTPARENIEALYELKQKLMTLKHATGPLQEYVGRLHGGGCPSLARVSPGTQCPIKVTKPENSPFSQRTRAAFRKPRSIVSLMLSGTNPGQR